jgi:hypothetical protein
VLLGNAGVVTSEYVLLDNSARLPFSPIREQLSQGCVGGSASYMFFSSRAGLIHSLSVVEYIPSVGRCCKLLVSFRRGPTSTSVLSGVKVQFTTWV